MAVFNESGVAPEIVNSFVPMAVAEQSIQSRLKVAKMRNIPMRLKIIEDMKRSHKIHIFNIGPWKQWVNTGSTGSYMIPACPEGQDYIELLVLDGDRSSPTFGQMVPPISVIMDELVIKSEDEMSRLEEDGRLFAESMIGLGKGQDLAFALTRFGIFVAQGDKPTAEELQTARESLNEECRQTVKFAGDLYATDRAVFAKVVRPAVHFVAAKVLGRDNPVDSPWMLDASPVGRVKCKVCGRVTEPDVAMCEGGHIVNKEKWLEYQASVAEVVEAAKPKGK